MMISIGKILSVIALSCLHMNIKSVVAYSSQPSVTETRRELLSNLSTKTAGIASLAFFQKPSSAYAIDELEIGSPSRPVAIIGGGGRTGMAVAETLASDQGARLHSVIMTRSGKDPFQIVKLPPTTKERLSLFQRPVDVRDAEGVLAAMKESNPSVVVYAASASKQGGNTFDVDDGGVENVARACKVVGAKLVLISALAVDRPNSKSYKITNTIGGYLDKIMDAKLNGETKVREILGDDYVIIRPGVLLSGKSKNGPNDIELNQGDTIGGGLSRDELAGIVAGAIESQKKGITVEAYRTSTRTKLQPEFVIPSGNEMVASTYSGLFDQVKSD